LHSSNKIAAKYFTEGKDKAYFRLAIKQNINKYLNWVGKIQALSQTINIYTKPLEKVVKELF
jgi:hypothetical protein